MTKENLEKNQNNQTQKRTRKIQEGGRQLKVPYYKNENLKKEKTSLTKKTQRKTRSTKRNIETKFENNLSENNLKKIIFSKNQN